MSLDLASALAKVLEQNPSLLTAILAQPTAAPKVEAPAAKKVAPKPEDKRRLVVAHDLTATLRVEVWVCRSKKGGYYVDIRGVNRLRPDGEGYGHIWFYKAEFTAFVNLLRGTSGDAMYKAVCAAGITEYVAG